MIRFALALSALLFPLSASAQLGRSDPVTVDINLEQRMMLRCSAALALVADRQSRGEEWALAYPPLAENGREFFVRSSARVMDQAQIDSAQVEQLLREEARGLLEGDTINQIMPICLQLLEQAGL